MTTTPTEAVLADYRKLAEECVDRLRRKYDFRAGWHRRWFRFTGIVVVVSGAALAPLAVFDYPRKPLVVALVGVLVGVVTGLRTFYQWDQNWAVLRRTHFDLTEAYQAWQLDFRHAQAGDDPTQVEERSYQATKTLLERVAAIRGSESERYFASVDFPSRKAG
jgi:hypothetical protein